MLIQTKSFVNVSRVTHTDVVAESSEQVDVPGPGGHVEQGGPRPLIPPLQVLVPQDHHGLLPGACLEELHELSGEGGPVLVPGAGDDVRHHVVSVLPGNLDYDTGQLVITCLLYNLI